MSSLSASADLLAFASHVKSFVPGRVRVRHPALRHREVAEESRRMLMSRPGVKDVEVNLLAGSALIRYDPVAVSRDELVARGIEWCRWLDAQA